MSSPGLRAKGSQDHEQRPGYRASASVTPGSYYDCDGLECDYPENLKICWVCQGCVKDDYSFALCRDCKGKGELCKNW